MKKSLKLIVTGGGTGGHVFPALAIASELKDRGITVLYVGGKRGLESKLVPQSAIPFFTVDSGQVKNQGLFKMFQTIFKLCKGILWSTSFLLKEKPDAVIGVGGYISFPICFSAWALRIPLYLQEQNVSVGIANRVLGQVARNIFIGFDRAKQYFPHKKTIWTGNPLRKKFYGTNIQPIQIDKPVLLILGGSQGAYAINSVILQYLEKFRELLPTLSILHQTGEKDFDRVRATYQTKFSGTYAIFPFISDMLKAYQEASIIVARAGALTVTEIIQVKRPTLFIPYPRKGQNDQTANAYLLKENGCAEVVEEGPNFDERFWTTFQSILKPPRLLEMSKHFSKLHVGNAAASIGDHIERDLMAKSGV